MKTYGLERMNAAKKVRESKEVGSGNRHGDVLYQQLRKARDNFNTVYKKVHLLKQRLSARNAKLHTLCKKENGQPLPSPSNIPSSPREQIDLSGVDRKKKQVLLCGSDPGVASTTVVHTATLESHINSINRFQALTNHSDTVDTINAFTADSSPHNDGYVSLNVTSKTFRWSNHSRPHQLTRQKKNNNLTQNALQKDALTRKMRTDMA
jgi:hypothetical protein